MRLLSRQRLEQLRHPERQRARAAVASALAAGRLVRPKRCAECNKRTKVHAHHDSYAKTARLKVRWLCLDCHKAEHPKREYLKNHFRDIRSFTDPDNWSRTKRDYACIHCKHEWRSFSKRPCRCPKCKTACWNRSKKQGGVQEKVSTALIRQRLMVCDWNFHAAARSLGIHYNTIRRRGFHKWRMKKGSIHTK